MATSINLWTRQLLVRHMTWNSSTRSDNKLYVNVGIRLVITQDCLNRGLLIDDRVSAGRVEVIQIETFWRAQLQSDVFRPVSPTTYAEHINNQEHVSALLQGEQSKYASYRKLI
jgi:hypothetical protein